MSCYNLPRLPKKCSKVTVPYKVAINNHTVTISEIPILFNCSQEFTQNFGILNIECKEYKNDEKKCVTTRPDLPKSLKSMR